MSKVVPFHRPDCLLMPLADGASLRVTPFIGSNRVAITLHGPGGGDVGGVILQTDRARLLASWLKLMAAASDASTSGAPPQRSAGQ